MRKVLVILFMTTITPHLFSQFIKVEMGPTLRGFSGSIESGSMYNLGIGGTVEQNVFLSWHIPGVGEIWTGFDFHVFDISGSGGYLRTYQIGLLGTFYIGDLGNSAFGIMHRNILPFVRLHSGAAIFEQELINVTKAQNLVAPFFGIQLGLAFRTWRNFYYKALYTFDAHIFHDGAALINGFELAVSYAFNL